MGGGDLNLKKSWHPSTFKNQERVWKAEQQKAEEDKKIAELQKELREERQREELFNIAETSGTIKQNENKDLNWMYKGPASHVSREEYLLGRKIDGAFQMLEKQEATEVAEKQEVQAKSSYTVEHDINPEAVVNRGETNNVQVDMKRKLLEDPLLKIRQSEEATKQTITSNPVKMKQLQLLLESLKEKKKKKKSKKSNSTSKKSKKSKKHKKEKKKKHSHHKKKELSTDDSDEEDVSSDELDSRRRNILKLINKESKRAAKKRHDSESQTNGSKRKRSRSPSNSPSSRRRRSSEKRLPKEKKKPRSESRDRSRDKYRDRDVDKGRERNKRRSEDRDASRDKYRDAAKERNGIDRDRNLGNYVKNPDRSNEKFEDRNKNRDRKSSKKQDKMSMEEMERKREEMMEAAKKRDLQRKSNVERYKEEMNKELDEDSTYSQSFIRKLGNESVSASVEMRIRSKVGTSQKSAGHMSSNFVRK